MSNYKKKIRIYAPVKRTVIYAPKKEVLKIRAPKWKGFTISVNPNFIKTSKPPIGKINIPEKFKNKNEFSIEQIRDLYLDD